MTKIEKFLGLGVLVAIVIAIGAYSFPKQAGQVAEALGSAGTRFQHGVSINTNTAPTGNGLLVGSNGTEFAGIKTGSCTIWALNNTIAASTTAQVECQSATNGTLASGLTGVTTDSVCQLITASSTNTTSNGLAVLGVSASSTAGSIVAQLSNFTGTTFTWTAAASSTPKWNYMCFDPS